MQRLNDADERAGARLVADGYAATRPRAWERRLSAPHYHFSSIFSINTERVERPEGCDVHSEEQAVRGVRVK